MLSTAKIFLLMLLLHHFADYTLQGCLANLKSKSWWGNACHEAIWGSFESQFKKYGHDYIAGLVCHSLYRKRAGEPNPFRVGMKAREKLTRWHRLDMVKLTRE